MYTCNISTFQAGFQFGQIRREPEKGMPDSVTRECQYAFF